MRRFRFRRGSVQGTGVERGEVEYFREPAMAGISRRGVFTQDRDAGFKALDKEQRQS